MFKTRQKGHAGPTRPKKIKMATNAEVEKFLTEELPTQKDGVIYIHVPFCDNICSFCSMNRTKLEDELDSCWARSKNTVNFRIYKLKISAASILAAELRRY